jgi:integrase
MAEYHDLLGGKVHVYQRARSRFWQCSTYLAGKEHRVSTKEESLARAKDFAEDWYLTMMGKFRAGELKTGKTFKQAADIFVPEFKIMTQGERAERCVMGHEERLRVHLLPYFGTKRLAEITPGVVQEYRLHRMQMLRNGKPPARQTLHAEIVTLRQVLKVAHRHGWIDHIPDMSAPYQTSKKVSHRAWFSPEEYTQLYKATRERSKNPRHERWRWAGEELHDFVLFMANTGIRPDEARRLEFRDVSVVKDADTGETILEIEVRGKRGVGFCKSMPGAVLPFQRLKKRRNPEPTDKLFCAYHRALFNKILGELGMKFDRDGRARTAYSLRHTYICMRLMEGADIYQIAKNCRTSVEMIETFYAAHIKNTLDAAAINVRKQISRISADSH